MNGKQKWPASERERLELLALLDVKRKARAVIEAGRPHYHGDPKRIPDSCLCPQCAAWDALAELLKTP